MVPVIGEQILLFCVVLCVTVTGLNLSLSSLSRLNVYSVVVCGADSFTYQLLNDVVGSIPGVSVDTILFEF